MSPLYFCSMDTIPKSKKKAFTKNLLGWYAQSSRPMPWKGEKNPYLVWLSEIILQQTRVEQGWPYFERFRDRYPSVVDLAKAPEDEVMKLWEGLGYYSRARNLHYTAQYIAKELRGVFPDTYEGLLALKGVGPYTAAAIASFAFDLPHAVVDGNVYRVLSRYFGIASPIDSTRGKKLFAGLAEELLDQKQPADYNQAIIDFGAIQCVPVNPDCGRCPLQQECHAFAFAQQTAFPVKEKKIKRRTRYFHYLILEFTEGLYIRKRLEKDIWQNLYEFPLIETTGPLSAEQLQEESDFQLLTSPGQASIEALSRPFQQQLTHQKIIAFFWEIRLAKRPEIKNPAYLFTPRENLSKFAFPKIIDRYLHDKSLYLKMI